MKNFKQLLMFHALKVVFHGSNRPFGRVFATPPQVRRKTRIVDMFRLLHQDRRKFNALLHDRRSVSHICCLSNTDEKFFCAPHAPQTLRTALFTLKSRHFRITATFGDDISPLASWLAANKSVPCRLTACLCELPRPIAAAAVALGKESLSARSRLRLPRRRIL